MGAYAVEVLLTRPATGSELAAARRAGRFPLAVSADRRRLLTVAEGNGWAKAVGSVWRAVADVLPVDVIMTVLADRRGEIRLSVRFDDPVAEQLRLAAAARGVSRETFLRDAVLRGTARASAARSARLDAAVGELLADATPEEIAASALRAISRAADGGGTASAPGQPPVT